MSSGCASRTIRSAEFIRLSLERLGSGRGRKLHDVLIRLRPETRTKLVQAGRTTVAYRGAEVLEHVAHHRSCRSACRHAHLDALRPERFELARSGFFQIEAVADGADRRHATKHLERHLHDLL